MGRAGMAIMVRSCVRESHHRPDHMLGIILCRQKMSGARVGIKQPRAARQSRGKHRA